MNKDFSLPLDKESAYIIGYSLSDRLWTIRDSEFEMEKEIHILLDILKRLKETFELDLDYL